MSQQVDELKDKPGIPNLLKRSVYRVLTIGAYDVSNGAIKVDKKAATVLAAVGIPVACFLHGYAGFIFGSVKANALWMSPLMPVIFIMSAVVSGIALCMLTYIVIMEWQAFRQRRSGSALVAGEIKGAEVEVITKAARYLLGFLVAAISLEMLDLIFRGYTAMKSWDILRSVMYGKDFINIFVLQYTLGNLVPFVLVDIARPNDETDRSGAIARTIRRFHDALERRDRRPGVLAVVLRVHALPHSDNPPQCGDV